MDEDFEVSERFIVPGSLNRFAWFLPPATKLGQGYVFTRVCDSVHWGGLPQCMLGYTPPGVDTPRETSGRYASYWNAYLFSKLLQMLKI